MHIGEVIGFEKRRPGSFPIRLELLGRPGDGEPLAKVKIFEMIRKHAQRLFERAAIGIGIDQQVPTPAADRDFRQGEVIAGLREIPAMRDFLQ